MINKSDAKKAIEMNEKAKAAIHLLADLHEQHGTLAPMVLTLALVMHCKYTGQDAEVHLAFGKRWEEIQNKKAKNQ
jgi:hypothetical protein